jgi:hypothetical protein
MKVAEPIDVDFSTRDSAHEPVRGAAVSSLSISASRIGRFAWHENGRRWAIERKARKSALSSSGLTMLEKSKQWQRTSRNGVVGVRARRQARTVQHLFGIEAMIDVMKDL